MYNEPPQHSHNQHDHNQHDYRKVKLLHSRYNPQAEAERYISSLSLGENIRFFILIEPGLGYITASIRKKFPNSKIIALHIEKPSGEETVKAPDSLWYPEAETPVQDFLETEIPDTKAGEIRLLEWRPALSVYGDSYLALVQETAEFLKRSDANARTFTAFGRVWVRNFFKNLRIIKNIICPPPISVPMLVIGSGPGLDAAIPLIREKQNGLFILASSSSLSALENGNIIPNLAITSDGTAWARFHLYELFRIKQEKQLPLAAVLSAVLPSQCENIPVMPISDGSQWQTLILSELKIPYIAMPQRGTVTASALDLAFALSDGEIFIAGINLANRDIRSHAKPYSLDCLMEENAERINPMYSQVYKRSAMLKEGGSYNIYASWFKKQLSSYPRRLFSIGDNNQVFSSPETAAENAIDNIRIAHNGKKTIANYKTFTLDCDYSRKAYKVLEGALKKSSCSGPLQKELRALLFQGEPSASSKAQGTDELIDSLAALCGIENGE